MTTLFRELRRRSVIKVGIAYAIVAWVLIQIVVSIEEPLHLPDWADTLVIVILAVGFPVALVLAWAFDLTPEGIRRSESTKTEVSISSEAMGDGSPSIAVLPFADMSPEKDQEYFGDGITEELLNSLARIKDLRVAGRTSSFYYKGRNEDLRSIGKALGVRYILEGSIRKSGDRVRITAQLIDANSDTHLWSETYDRTFEDLFRVQEDIAKSVAVAMQITLGVGGLAKVPGMTNNPEAYEEYLKANVKRGVQIITPLSETAYRDAIRHLERAVRIDPEFSPAWIGLHFLYDHASMIIADGISNSDEKSARARERSLSLTPDSPFVLFNLMMTEVNRGNWLEAQHFHARALAAAQQHGVEDHFAFRGGIFYHMVGDLENAVDLYEQALTADPLYPMCAAYVSDAYCSMGASEQALREVDRFANFEHPSVVLVAASGVMAAMVTGDRSELERRLEELIRVEPIAFLTTRMRELLDDRDAAMEVLYEKLDDDQPLPPFQKNIIAVWAAYWGDKQLALRILREILVDEPYNRHMVYLLWRGVFGECRKLPEYKQILMNVGLVDYWRESSNWGMFCRPLGDDDFEVL